MVYQFPEIKMQSSFFSPIYLYLHPHLWLFLSKTILVSIWTRWEDNEEVPVLEVGARKTPENCSSENPHSQVATEKPNPHSAPSMVWTGILWWKARQNQPDFPNWGPFLNHGFSFASSLGSGLLASALALVWAPAWALACAPACALAWARAWALACASAGAPARALSAWLVLKKGLWLRG